MKYERDRPNAHRTEWSQFQNGSEAGLGQAENDGEGSSSSKKKKRGVLFGIETPAEKGNKSGKAERPVGQEAESGTVSEGDIWIRAASNRVREKAEQPKQPETVPSKEDEILAESVHDTTKREQDAEQAEGKQADTEPKAPQEEQEDQDAEQQLIQQPESRMANESDINATAERPELVRGEPVEWQQLPEQQAQGRDEEQASGPEGPVYESPVHPGETTAEYDDPGQPGYGEAEVGEPFMYSDYREPEPDATRIPNPFERNNIPPLPPSPSEYRRVFWQEQPTERPDEHSSLPPVYDYRQAALANQPLTANEATSWTRPTTEVAAPYASNLPPGLQRSPREVSQAAWTGLIAGWFFGRRGKNKAAKQARNQGFDEGQRAALAQSNPYEQPHRQAEQTYNPYRSLEAAPLHSYPQAEGGRVTVQPTSVETRPAPAAEVSLPRTQNPAEARPQKTAEAPAAVTGARSERALGKTELMKIAKDIKVDGIRLKDVYDAKRIDEEGLRAVVESYLRGGDIKQVLTQEVINKEKSYERDPMVRHQRSSGQVAGAIAKAASLAGVSKDKVKQASQSAAENVKKGAKQAQHDVIENSSSEMWVMVTVAVIIYALIAVLLFN